MSGKKFAKSHKIINFAVAFQQTVSPLKLLSEYHLPVVDLMRDNYSATFHLENEFFGAADYSDLRGGNVTVVLHTKLRDDHIALIFSLKGHIDVECNRCLDLMTLPIDTTYQCRLKQAASTDSVEDDDGDEDTFYYYAEEPSIDIAPIVRDTLVLEIPMSCVHEDGECNQQMIDLLNGNDDNIDTQQEQPTDPRWEALRQFKDNNK